MGNDDDRYVRELRKEERWKLFGNIALGVGIAAAVFVLLWAFVFG